MEIKQAISPEIFNSIIQKACEEYRKDPDKGEYVIADDVCRPYLANFGRDMNSYETMVFHVRDSLAFMFNGVGFFHD